MARIDFSSVEKERLLELLIRYFEHEFELDLGQFESEFLLDFISQEMGPTYYNQGLKDAQSVLLAKVDDLTYAIEELEQATGS